MKKNITFQAILLALFLFISGNITAQQNGSEKEYYMSTSFHEPAGKYPR